MPLKKIYGNEFNRAAVAGAVLLLDLDDGTPKIMQGVILRGVGHTGAGPAGELDLRNVISKIRLLQDTREKAVWYPTLQRKLDDFLNANADTLKVGHMYIPFNRFLDPGRGWGNKNYGRLFLEVTMVNPYPANNDCTAIKPIIAYNDIPQKLDRGDVYVQTILPQAQPVAGWNTINDLPYLGITHLTKLLFDHAAITEVEIYRGTELRYQMKKSDQLFELEINPLFKHPATASHIEVDGAYSASTGPFPAFLDSFGNPGQALPLFVGDERQQIKVRYFWDTTNAAVAAFDVLAEGIERDPNAQAVGTTAAARA